MLLAQNLFLICPTRSLFELDLHGLHGQEATAALDQRLALLHGVLEDAATAAAAGGGAGHQLRVIVGRGVHSSEGEASLPRVVETHLAAGGYRSQRRGGAIDVPLRGPAALRAAAQARS